MLILEEFNNILKLIERISIINIKTCTLEYRKKELDKNNKKNLNLRIFKNEDLTKIDIFNSMSVDLIAQLNNKSFIKKFECISVGIISYKNLKVVNLNESSKTISLFGLNLDISFESIKTSSYTKISKNGILNYSLDNTNSVIFSDLKTNFKNLEMSCNNEEILLPF